MISNRTHGTGEAPVKPHRRKSVYVGMLVIVCALELWGLSRYFPPEVWLNAESILHRQLCTALRARAHRRSGARAPSPAVELQPQSDGGLSRGDQNRADGRRARRVVLGMRRFLPRIIAWDKRPFCTNCWWWDCWRRFRQRWHWRRCGLASIGGWRCYPRSSAPWASSTFPALL